MDGFAPGISLKVENQLLRLCRMDLNEGKSQLHHGHLYPLAKRHCRDLVTPKQES